MATDTNAGAGVQSARPGILAVLAELHGAGQPIVMTVNGTDFVVQDDGSYQRLIALVGRLETIRDIREALQDVEAGRTLPLDESKAEVQGQHGISG